MSFYEAARQYDKKALQVIVSVLRMISSRLASAGGSQ